MSLKYQTWNIASKLRLGDHLRMLQLQALHQMTAQVVPREIHCGLHSIGHKLISNNHKMIGFEGTFHDHLVHPLCHGTETFHQLRLLKALPNLTFNVMGHIQLLHNIYNRAKPVFLRSHSKDFRPYIFLIFLNLPSFRLQPLPLVLSLQALVKSLSKSFL